jgi:type I restriction enzyme S subunit
MFFAKTMQGYKICHKGDLIINTMWAWMGALGTSKYNGICSPAYNVYRANKFTDYNYLYFDYLFRIPSFIIEMTRYSKGIVQSRLRLYPRDFFKIKTILPPLKTQIKIATYLDIKTQKIDKEITLLEQKIEKYRELKQTLINETVLRGLDRGVEFKDSGIEWIGNIPKSWTTDRLKNIFDERVGKNLDKSSGEAVTKNILSVMKDVGVINHRDKGNVGNKMAEDITNYKLVYPNDIVVNKMNIMIGSVGISKEFGALSVIYIILITKENHFTKYYDYFFKMKAFQRSLRRIATGILEIREAVNMTLFMQEAMTVPPYEEQVEIANYLDEKTSKIDDIVETLSTKIEILKEFRKTLINDVVTGKVKVV